MVDLWWAGTPQETDKVGDVPCYVAALVCSRVGDVPCYVAALVCSRVGYVPCYVAALVCPASASRHSTAWVAAQYVFALTEASGTYVAGRLWRSDDYGRAGSWKDITAVLPGAPGVALAGRRFAACPDPCRPVPA